MLKLARIEKSSLFFFSFDNLLLLLLPFPSSSFTTSSLKSPHDTSLLDNEKPCLNSHSSSLSTTTTTTQLHLLLSHFTNGRIPLALSLFKQLFQSNTRYFNSWLKRFSNAESFDTIVNLYDLLSISNDAKPDNFTFPCVLKACSNVAPFKGKSVHLQIIKTGFEHNVSVGNSLIDLYSKSGCLLSARKIFDRMSTRNLVSWNTMVSGYVLNGFPDTALEFCGLMKFHGMGLDKVGLKIVLPACSQLGALGVGRSTHARIIVSGFSSDTVLVTALIDMYAKCKNLDVARRLFEEIPCKDVVCWNAMINGYSKNGQLELVLELFRKMQMESVRSSVVTVLTSCQACADLVSVRRGETMHGYIVKLGFDSDSSVGILLMNMYSKCGELNLAYQIFQGLVKEDVNSWSTMIHALGMHGYGEAALMGFFKMLKRGIDPDGLCFLLLLSCCSHTGLVKEGLKIFNFMVKHFRIVPNMEHYVTMVDLMGRVGLIDEAFRFITQMPIEPSIDVWGALLSACRIHGDLKMGRISGEQLSHLVPETSGYYKLLHNIYVSKGHWDEAYKIRNLMLERRTSKLSGCSLIELTQHQV